ncbi:acyltransferase family protein [Thermomonas sp.]|uniref:acyltransferase family protein n=1 Tax=Thermomonas sp. TaxID=1971895 RepID=UPI002CBE76D4|nr:acyltransferase family protein [Thermomonas sp.]HRO63184.1 acyltransferase family protein [Thermomonas sp.]
MAELTYRRHIDGLRAVAVLAVVAFHAGVPWLPGGYVGVDVFFVVSGFLITGLLLREFETRGDISLVGFYERRVRRLAPALLLVLAVTLVLGALFLVPIGGEQQGLAKSTIATLLLGSNVWFAHATGGYFDAPAAAQPLLHTWSLSVEEQFYLVWPALLLLASRWAKRRGRDPDRAAAATLALVGLASLVLSIVTTRTHPEFAFFGSPTRAWEFAIGGLAFFLIRRRSAPIPLAQPLALLGLAAIIWACVSFVEGETPFPGWRAGIPALGAALVILGGEHNERGWCTRWLTLRPMVFIGLLSYSLYLWHWPLLVVARLETLGEIGPWPIAGICLLSFVLAWLTYQYVENPLRRKQYPLMATRKRAFVVGVAGCALVMGLAGGLGVWSRLGWRGDSGQAALQVMLQSMQKSRTPCAQKEPYEGQLLSDPRCDLPKAATTGRAPDILLWGDSHADALAVMMEVVARDRGQVMRIRFMPACPPLPGYSPLQRFPGEDDHSQSCEKFNSAVLAEALRLQRTGLTTVVMEAHWPAYVKTPEALRAATAALNKAVAQLTRVGLRVVLIEPKPDQRHEVPACLARRPAAQCGRPRAEVEAYRRAAREMIVQAGKVPGVQLLDPLPALCTRDFCPGVLGGDVLYSDSHHLTVAGAMHLRPAFAQALPAP